MRAGVKHSDYVTWCRDAGWPATTRDMDVMVARRFAVLTGVSVDDADPGVCDWWWRQLRGLSSATRATYLRALRRFYRWREVRGGPPDPSIAISAPQVTRRLPRPIPTGDVQLILALTSDTDRAAQIGLGYYAGLRVSEIARARPDHVHTGHDGRTWLRVDGKGGHVRMVPVPAELDQLLASYSWPDTTGRRLSVALRDLMHRLGFPYCAHQLRHSYATRVLSSSGNVVVVQRLLGHASVATTQVYADVEPAQLADAVDEAFSPRRLVAR